LSGRKGLDTECAGTSVTPWTGDKRYKSLGPRAHITNQKGGSRHLTITSHKATYRD